MLPWFKADTDAIVDGMLDHEWSSPAPFYLAVIEWQALVAAGRADRWSHARLAKRWQRPICWARKVREHASSQANRKQIADGSQEDNSYIAAQSQVNRRSVASQSQGRSSGGAGSGAFDRKAIADESQMDRRSVADTSQEDSKDHAGSRARILNPKILEREDIDREEDKEGDDDAHQQHSPVALSGDCELTQEKPRAEESPQQMTLGIQAQVHLPVASVKAPTAATKRKRGKEPLLELKDLTAEMRARVEPALERLLKAQRIGIRVETGERLDLDNPVYWLQQMAETYPHLDLANEIGRADSWLVAKREVRAKPRVWFCTVWLPRARPADHAQHAQSLPMNGQPTLDDLIAAGRSARRENRSSEFGRVYGRLWGKSPLPLVYATTVDHEPGARDCPCWGCLHQLGWWPGPRAWTDRPVSGDDPRAMQGGHTPTAGQYQADEPWVDE